MTQAIFWAMVFFAVFFEGVVTMPFVLLLLTIFYICTQEPYVFVAAFLAGLVLDTLLLRTFGISSLFLVSFLFVVFLYERKFEIQTIPFVFFISLLGTTSYFLLLHQKAGVMSILWSTLLFTCLFVCVRHFLFRKRKEMPLL